MQILLDVKSPSDLWALLEYLRSLQAVKIILPPKNGASKAAAIENETPSPGQDETRAFDTTSIQLIAEMAESDLVFTPPHRKQDWDFNRFYGAAKSGMTIEEIDIKLKELRNEWERDTY